MNKLNRMAIFANVVEEGSLSGASRRLGMTASAVSQHLRSLEKELGVKLLHRSTRNLALTEAGQAFYPGCEAMLAEARRAELRLADLRDTLVGELRIATTVGIGGTLLAQAMSPLLLAHPKLTLSILANDEVVDMIEQRVDIALRVNRQLADSNMIAHSLAEWPMVICASPRYLNQYGVPENVQDLARHRWINNIGSGHHYQLTLINQQGDDVKLKVESQVLSSSMNVLRDFTSAGMGLSVQPLHEISHYLLKGELLIVLPEWRPKPSHLHALTLGRDVPEKVKQTLHCLRDYFSYHRDR